MKALLRYFPDQSANPALAHRYNEHMTRIYEDIRDFITLHYHLAGRQEPFWQDAGNTRLSSALQALLDFYDATGRMTGEPAVLWSGNLVGFGSYRYYHSNGTPNEFFLTGFAPRKQNLVVYIMPGFSDCQPLLENLGKHKTGKSCLYQTRLDRIDRDILLKIIADSVDVMRKRYS